MGRDRCPGCGALYALVGRSHKCRARSDFAGRGGSVVTPGGRTRKAGRGRVAKGGREALEAEVSSALVRQARANEEIVEVLERGRGRPRGDATIVLPVRVSAELVGRIDGWASAA